MKTWSGPVTTLYSPSCSKTIFSLFFRADGDAAICLCQGVCSRNHGRQTPPPPRLHLSAYPRGYCDVFVFFPIRKTFLTEWLSSFLRTYAPWLLLLDVGLSHHPSLFLSRLAFSPPPGLSYMHLSTNPPKPNGVDFCPPQVRSLGRNPFHDFSCAVSRPMFAFLGVSVRELSGISLIGTSLLVFFFDFSPTILTRLLWHAYVYSQSPPPFFVGRPPLLRPPFRVTPDVQDDLFGLLMGYQILVYIVSVAVVFSLFRLT